MNLWLRRFAFVGLTATVIDIGLAVLLIQFGIPIWISKTAEPISITVAARPTKAKRRSQRFMCELLRLGPRFFPICFLPSTILSNSFRHLEESNSNQTMRMRNQGDSVYMQNVLRELNQ